MNDLPDEYQPEALRRKSTKEKQVLYATMEGGIILSLSPNLFEVLDIIGGLNAKVVKIDLDGSIEDLYEWNVDKRSWTKILKNLNEIWP